jgi:multicomponent K+:H+ antiporter subunit G
MEAAVSILLVSGAAFVALGSFGLAKLSHFLRRVHAPAKATTLGVGALLLGSALYFGAVDDTGLAGHQFVLIVFLFITAPVSAAMLVRAAISLDRGSQPPPQPGPPAPAAPQRPDER